MRVLCCSLSGAESGSGVEIKREEGGEASCSGDPLRSYSHYTLCPVHGSLCVRICEPLDVPAKSNSPRGQGGYALL